MTEDGAVMIPRGQDIQGYFARTTRLAVYASNLTPCKTELLLFRALFHGGSWFHVKKEVGCLLPHPK